MMNAGAIVVLAIAAFAVTAADRACTIDHRGSQDGNPCGAAHFKEDIGGGKTACCPSGSMVVTRKIRDNAFVACNCRETSPKPSPQTGQYLIGHHETIPVNDFRQAALKAHNKLRALHGSKPLKLSNDLNAYAQRWAEHMATVGKMFHSNTFMDSGEKLGENVAAMTHPFGADFRGPEPVQWWYDEIKLYDFNKAWGQPGTGHFTQLVWKNTTEIGLGKARTADGTGVYICASYRSPGNFKWTKSYWQSQVPRPL